MNRIVQPIRHWLTNFWGGIESGVWRPLTRSAPKLKKNIVPPLTESGRTRETNECIGLPFMHKFRPPLTISALSRGVTPYFKLAAGQTTSGACWWSNNLALGTDLFSAAIPANFLFHLTDPAYPLPPPPPVPLYQQTSSLT